jgi:hypothetical protein
MKKLTSRIGFGSTSILVLTVLLSVGAYGQTYTTIADGNWSAAATWLGGSVPPTASDIPATAVINIRHSVAYNTGNPIKNRGVIRIEPIIGTTAILTVPTGINVENYSTGSFYILNATYRQCRFTPCNNGEPYSGTNPGAPKQAGTFKNLGGYIEVRNSAVEIAQDWTSETGGTRLIVDSCITTGQNFSLSSPSTSDSITRSQISVGWHGSGNFEFNDGFANYSQLRVQVAGTSGSFKLDSGTANGHITTVQLQNQFVPFIGGGEVSASSSLVTSGLIHDSYCVLNSSKYIPNGKFSGAQTLSCSAAGLACFPVSSAGASVTGRVITPNGNGIRDVMVSIAGGELEHPLQVATSNFGYFRFEDIPAGGTYVVTVQSRRFRFSSPSTVITLNDSIAGIDFVADGDPDLPGGSSKGEALQRELKQLRK